MKRRRAIGWALAVAAMLLGVAVGVLLYKLTGLERWVCEYVALLAVSPLIDMAARRIVG